MLNCVVCIKQVPETGEVEIDQKTGTLKREGVDSKINLYDLYALETGVQLTESHGGMVTALSMGPPQAAAAIHEAYTLGAHHGVLLSDRKFAGADTLATSYTLAQAIKKLPHVDLILTGMQTSDGDTAQVGPALAELLGIPHISYVKEVVSFETTPDRSLIVKADMTDCIETIRVKLPALLTLTKDACQPRLPSYRLKLASAERPIEVWSYNDLQSEHNEANHFGLDGSPTQVERIFPPSSESTREVWTGTADQLAYKISRTLRELKFV